MVSRAYFLSACRFSAFCFDSADSLSCCFSRALSLIPLFVSLSSKIHNKLNFTFFQEAVLSQNPQRSKPEPLSSDRKPAWIRKNLEKSHLWSSSDVPTFLPSFLVKWKQLLHFQPWLCFGHRRQVRRGRPQRGREGNGPEEGQNRGQMDNQQEVFLLRSSEKLYESPLTAANMF